MWQVERTREYVAGHRGDLPARSRFGEGREHRWVIFSTFLIFNGYLS